MLGRLWERLPKIPCLHADHHYLGRYSIEKLHLFDQYRRAASPLRIAAVLLFTPMPTFLLLTAIDLAPLNSPNAGPSQNAVAFVRSAVSHAIMTFFTMLPMKQALSLSDHEYSLRKIALIACCTSLTIEALCIPLAFAWRFPVPFREMIGLPIFLASVCVYNLVFANSTMRRLWRQRKLQLYVPIVGVQINLFYLFLAISVGFAYMPLALQTVMILLFPFVKVLLKQLVWKYAKRLDDISTDVTICMLEISGALYQTVCIQFVNSPVLDVLIALTDFVQAAHEVHTYVGMDYLGDGRHTLETALKIVESSLFDQSERRMSRCSTCTQTQSVAAKTEYGDDADTSVFDGQRNSLDLTSSFSRKPTLRRTQRSSAESLSLAMFGEGDEETKQSETEAIKAAQRRVEIQGKSVVMPSKAFRERTANGKRRRRLLDLDLMRVEVSDGRMASRGRISQDDMMETQDAPAAESPTVASSIERADQPAAIVRSQSAKSFSSSASLELSHHEGNKEAGVKLSVQQRISRSNSSRSSASVALTPEWSDLTSEPKLHDKPKPAKLKKLPSRYLVVPVDLLVGGATPSKADPPSAASLQSRRPQRRISIDDIRVTRRDQARILEQTLQLLFASEVLLFVEYMEVVVPVLYALIIGCEWATPNRKYNLVVMNMSSAAVAVQLQTSMAFALLELVSMLAMYWVMRRKYGVSALYQLAFVLERYWMTLQGKLVGSFIVVLNAVTVHQGTDFSFLQGS